MRSFVVALLSLLVLACSPEDPPPAEGEGRLGVTVDGRSVSAGQTVQLDPGGLAVGASGAIAELVLANVGDGDLALGALTISPGPFTLSAAEDSIAEPVMRTLGIAESLTLYVHLTRPDAAAAADVRLSKPAFAFQVAIPAPSTPRIAVEPSVLDWGPWFAAGTLTKNVVIRNSGDADLIVSAPTLEGDSVFTLDAAALAPFPLTLASGAEHTLPVRYTAVAPIGSASGKLVIRSNDPTQARVDVALTANAANDACITVTPELVDARADHAATNHTVTVRSCGGNALRVNELTLEQTGDAWKLVTTSVPELVNGAEHDVVVHFEGDPGVTTEDASAVLVITSNGGEKRVTLDGPITCPTPHIADVVHEVTPETELSLSGADSTTWSGAIVAYNWSLVQPEGSAAAFSDEHDVDPEIVLNVVGTYTLSLAIEDEYGRASCAPASVTVEVKPRDGLHFELVWSTPGDLDPSDEGFGFGADVDLHVLHPAGPGGYARSYDGDADGAPDGWFDNAWDCYWFAAEPSWGAALERDDVDGAGPENVRIASPESGTTYKIAVHYWESNQFGASIPGLRIYDDGALIVELPTGPSLERADMWIVGELEWPSGTMTWLVDCGEEAPRRCAEDDLACVAECEWLVVPHYSVPVELGFLP